MQRFGRIDRNWANQYCRRRVRNNSPTRPVTTNTTTTTSIAIGPEPSRRGNQLPGHQVRGADLVSAVASGSMPAISTTVFQLTMR
jgi:hypothetical protein